MPTFDEDMMNWWMFWEQYEVSIHSRTWLTDAEKLAYLRHLLKDSPGWHIIKGFSGFGSEYQEAIECLQKHYDRPWLLHHIKTGTVFNSTTTGAQFRAKATADCGTSNVVYLIECRRCAIQYVGETENALHVRLTGHRSDIKHRRIEKPVAKHFSLPDHSMEDLKLMVIEKIHREDSEYRKRKESRWIEMIRSRTPDGLNLNP